MDFSLDLVTESTWLVWLLYWWWSARDAKRPVRVEQPLARFFKYSLPLMVAVLLLVRPFPSWLDGMFDQRFIPFSPWVVRAGLALTCAGLLFACWARHVLGRNWSAVVQLKQDHELIEAGPYGYVRHPIYTGLLLAFLGTGMMIGEWRGLLALAIVAVSFWRKLRLEERWLGDQFGAAYVDYMQRVKALVPGVL